MRKVRDKETEIVIQELEQDQITFCILGSTPLIYHAMSFKSKQMILSPSGRKTAADKAATLKHNPMEEYVESTYRRRASLEGPTRLVLPSTMFKAAISDVAKRVPGTASTTEMKQLVWITEPQIDLYGIPQIFMAPVRQAGMSQAPDIRTRAIVPQWACEVTITYTRPQLTAQTLGRLVSAAGVLNGIGDMRQQKGAGNFGQFQIVSADDPRFKALVKNGGMAAQDRALKSPEPYDQETEELLNWFQSDLRRRELKVA